MEETHQETREARELAHQEMLQVPTQQEGAGAARGLRGAAGVPSTFLPRWERKQGWHFQASLGRGRNIKA